MRSYSCPNYGTITPTICNEGTFQSNMRKTVCEPCPRGLLLHEGTRTNKMSRKELIKTQRAERQKTSVNLVQGHYCPNKGTEEPIPCEKGCYQKETGKTTCNFCGDIGKFSNNKGR